ncbi:hypothetical protein TIFTF001_026248 [Ficus carica]|uniref:Uncharacterized protein n=1 Tax=Ficus carica TaxID=3494 RepID=A0AA88IXY5_FICCA|nr:hypothetical protein TIFTF001_026248 [Ficus carica]
MYSSLQAMANKSPLPAIYRSPDSRARIPRRRCRFAFPPTARCHVAYPTRGELCDTWQNIRQPFRERPSTRVVDHAHLSDVDLPSPTAGWGMHPWTRPAQRCWGAYVDDQIISDYRPSFSARIVAVPGTAGNTFCRDDNLWSRALVATTRSTRERSARIKPAPISRSSLGRPPMI